MHLGSRVIQTWYSFNHLNIFTTTRGINSAQRLSDDTIGISFSQDVNGLAPFVRIQTSTGCFWAPQINARSNIEPIRRNSHVHQPSKWKNTLWASQWFTQVIHISYTSKSPGFSANVSSWFNAREVLHWHGYNILIYMRRQLCKYLEIFVFIISDVYFLVCRLHFSCTVFMIQLPMSGLEDKCAVGFVKCLQDWSQVCKESIGFCVRCL